MLGQQEYSKNGIESRHHCYFVAPLLRCKLIDICKYIQVLEQNGDINLHNLSPTDLLLQVDGKQNLFRLLVTD